MSQNHRCVALYTSENSSIILDGREIMYSFDLYECPEDASINRDIPHCADITQLIKRVYDLAASGDTVSFEFIECESETEFSHHYNELTGRSF